MGSFTADQIAERVWLSIAERRLRPGTRLKETELAEVFTVSRARVRQALALLERDGLVSSEANKGSFVAEPDAEEARDVFHIRRALEQRVLERLAHRLDACRLAQLRAHIAQEREAGLRDDRRAIIRLSGGFHLMLAEMSGSVFLTGLMRDLVSRSSLITAAFRDSHRFDCGPDEHEEIVNLLEERNSEGARNALVRHLDHVEGELSLDGSKNMFNSLKEALVPEET